MFTDFPPNLLNLVIFPLALVSYNAFLAIILTICRRNSDTDIITKREKGGMLTLTEDIFQTMLQYHSYCVTVMFCSIEAAAGGGGVISAPSHGRHPVLFMCVGTMMAVREVRRFPLKAAEN